jgi:hypothetical protein
MKSTVLTNLRQFKTDLQALRKDVKANRGERVSQKSIRNQAENLATRWVEDIRSPLEHKFKVSADVIRDMSENMKQLHVLSRPNNRTSSYLKILEQALRDFDDRLVLPVQQLAVDVESVFDLQKLVPGLTDPAESEYLDEAVRCAAAGFKRASIVLGWCAAVDRMQRKILLMGLASFNATSTKLKAQVSGKFKRWNKEFSISTLSELQTVLDTDLVVVLEGMGLLDGNQAERLETCFQYRNHSAHPGEAPIGDAHVVAFFTDINEIILRNPSFSLD